LFVRGDGASAGFASLGNDLNLYMSGSGWAGGFASPIPVANTTSMFISGKIDFVYRSTNIANMFLKTIEANSITGTKTMYMSGGSPNAVTNQATLVIPKTGMQSTIPMYVHGF
jgi:hypothetical protein